MTKSFAIKTMTKNREVEMRFFDSSHAYDLTMVSGILVFAFDAQGRILVLKDKKGFSLLRGEIEWDDDTGEDAARREVLELADATLSSVSLAAFIETTVEDSFTQDPVITLVFAGCVDTLDSCPSSGKDRRVFLSGDDFLESCAPENAELQPQLMALVARTLGQR